MPTGSFDINELKRRMQGATQALKHELGGLRTGRASASMLEPVQVDAYGTHMPLNQLATISVPEPRLLSVQVWDKSMVKAVEKAIVDSNLGLSPATEGQVLRLRIPELNEERRRELAKVAHKHGVPLIVDNTIATPILLRPIEYGADVIVHSMTKFMGGHGTTLGGMIVDSGKFPWRKYPDKFYMFNRPEIAYHGVVYVEHYGDAAYVARCRTVCQRNTGATLSPFNGFLLLQGVETLALRMERHVENARKVAEYLRDHPMVEWINYAGFPENPLYPMAQRYLGSKRCSLLTFGVKGGFEAGKKCFNALKLFKRMVNMGDAKSLACHPASTTHRQLTPEEQEKVGVTPEMLRLSVGIEHIDDIIDDLAQALGEAKVYEAGGRP